MRPTYYKTLQNLGLNIGRHRHRPWCRRYPTFDIDISYSDIGTKMSDKILSLWYRNSSDIDINFHSDIGLNQYRIFRYLNLIIISSKIVTHNFLPWFRTHNLSDKYLATYHCATRIYQCWCRISNIGQKIIPISDIMLDSALFSPISDVPISGSVRYRWSQITDWVPTYGAKPVDSSMKRRFVQAPYKCSLQVFPEPTQLNGNLEIRTSPEALR